MHIDEVRTLAAPDMQRVDDTIRERLQSDVALINQLGNYIINSGGKRLRPMLVTLSANACGYGGDQHINLAAVIEFIHTSTLLHDDVVDASELRRGRETANALFGNEASVLVGDFLYSRSFQMMVQADSMRVLKILSDATNIIAEGEVMQLMNCHDPDTDEPRYMDVIRYKTAKLFEAAGQLGAVVARADEATITALGRYGMHLGTAFQLVDDVLDYRSDAETMGKEVGDDLAEGKPTLPLIHAMRTGTEDQARLIREAIETGGRDQLEAIVAAVDSCGSLAYTSELAREEARQAETALEGIPDSPWRDALACLAQFAVSSDH